MFPYGLSSDQDSIVVDYENLVQFLMMMRRMAAVAVICGHAAA